MRTRAFSAVTAGALVLALATWFAPAAGARPSAGIKSAHVGHAVAAKVHASGVNSVLYDQNNNDSGVGIVSQNFETAFDIYDSQGADSFKVPKGHTWTIKEVDVTGVYFNGAGPAVSENVTVYKNSGGLPGAVVKSQTKVGVDNGTGSFQIKKLKINVGKGKYFVSVQANMDFGTGGEWGWEGNLVGKTPGAAWQNPGDGFATGCTVYANEVGCLGDIGQGPDFMFALVGTST